MDNSRLAPSTLAQYIQINDTLVMNKINPGDKFVTISIDKNGLTVSRESEVKPRGMYLLSDDEFCDGTNRFNENNLYPCELSIVKPVNFEPKLHIYAKVEDKELATLVLREAFIDACNDDIREANLIIQNRIYSIQGAALSLYP